MKNHSYKKVEALLRRCQKILRLQDWTITLKIVGPNVMPDNRVAQCQWSFRNMEAVVTVLDPKYNHEEGLGFDNMEATIFHELLHIIITPIVSDKVSDDWHEQVIERIAKALARI